MEESFLFNYLTFYSVLSIPSLALCLNYTWHNEGLNNIPIKNIFHVMRPSTMVYIKTFLMDANYNF